MTLQLTHSTFPPIFQVIFIRNQTTKNKEITCVLQYSRVQCDAMRIPNILVRIWEKREENIQIKMIQE